MYAQISDFGFIQTAMRRICSGLLFAGLVATAHIAQSEENHFAPDLDILTIQPVRTDNDRLIPYRLNARLALSRSTDSAPADSKFNNTPRLYLVAASNKDAAWSTNARWQIAPSGDQDRISLSPILRLESKGERFEIKPRRHSIWFAWHKTFP